MKKVSILALHLNTGGIERSIATRSNILAKKYEVEIIVTYKLLDKPAFDINDNVKITYLTENIKPNSQVLKAAIKSKNIFKIIKEIIYSLKVLYLKKHTMIKAIKSLDSDIVISTRDYYNKLLGKYKTKNKNVIRIAEEHNHHRESKKYINNIINSLKNIDYFMPVSEELTKFYSEKLENSKTKCVYIPHSLDRYPDAVSSLKSKSIISIGRLSSEKGFDRLIEAFKIVSDKYPEWTLKIAGDGPEKENILNDISKNKLEEKVKLYGFLSKDELEKLFLDSSIYAMASRTESFGLVLIEAESYGLPIVVMESARGAYEVVNEKENGEFSSEDPNDMANKIIKLIEDETLRKSYGENGRKFCEKYKEENISKMWYNFIDNLNGKEL